MQKKITQLALLVTLIFIGVSQSARAQIVGPSAVCAGSTAAFTDSISGGVWSSSDTSLATVTASGGVVTGVTAGSAIISYTTSSGIQTASVTIETPPDAGTISGPTAVCVYSATTFTNSVTGGTWSAGGYIDAATGDYSSYGSGTDIVSYTVTNSCGTATDTIALTIEDASFPTYVDGGVSSGASGYGYFPNEICSGTSGYASTDGLGGEWTTSDTYMATIDASGNYYALSPGSFDIYYTVSNSCGYDYRSVTIRSDDAPHAGTITGTGSFCAYSGYPSVHVSGASGTGYWTGSGCLDYDGSVIGVGYGSLTYVVENTCGSDATTPFDVDAQDSPDAWFAVTNPYWMTSAYTDTGYVCPGGVTDVYVDVDGGHWSTSDGSIAVVSAYGSYYGATCTGYSTGVAIISYTVSNTCGTGTRTQPVRVLPSLGAGTITGPTTINVGATATFSESVSGGYWSTDDYSIATIDGSGVLTGVSAGTMNVLYDVYSDGCPSPGTWDQAYHTVTVISCTPPSVDSIVGAGTVCIGSAITLTDTASGGSWSSSNTSVATVDTAGHVTGVGSGTATIYYSATNSCGTVNATHAVTVSPAPVAGTLSGASSVCIAANTTLTTSGSSGGAWSSSSTALATVSSAGVVRGVSGGTVTISYTVTTGCGSAVATKTMAVNTYAGAISGTSNICRGSATTLTSTVSGGTWSSLSTSIATVTSSGGVVTGVAGGSATIRYTTTGTCGAGHTDFNMVVSAPGAISASSGASTLCMGASATFTNTTSPGGGTWSSSNTGIATVSSSGGVVTGVSGGTASITYTLTNACGTVTTARNITITGTPAPAAISGSSSAVCVGSTLALTDGTAGGTWSSANTSVATISSTGLVTAISAGTDTIRYSVTNSCGFTGSVFRVVTVNISAPVTLGGTSSICTGGTTTLTTAATGGTWSSMYTSIATITSGGVVTGVNSGMDTLKYTVTNSCGTFVSRFPLLIASPFVAAISGSSSVCPGASTTFTDATAGGSWSSTNTTLATVSAAGVVSGLVSGTDTIVYTITNACGTMPVTRSVIITGPTYPYAISGSVSTICTGATAPYANATSGGVWSMTNTSIATINASGTVTGIAGGIDTIKYTITNSCGIPGAATRAILILAPPTAGTISGPANICTTGGAITYTSSGDAGGTWSSTNPSAATVSAAGIVTPVSASATTIKYTVTNSCGTNIASQYVTVSAPGITSSTGPTSLCLGSSATFANATAGGTWSSSASGIATVSASGLVTSVSVGTASISYTITNACGTTSTARNVAINTSVPTGISISGPSTVAIGATITLTHAGATGTWSSGTPSLATITTGGVVTGVAVGIDTIKYTVTNGCGTTVATKAVSVTAHRGAGPGFVSEETTSYKLFPNPTTGIVKLQFTGNRGETSVIVTDVSGKILITRSTEEKSLDIDLSNAAAGVYLVTIKIADTVYREKVVVQ